MSLSVRIGNKAIGRGKSCYIIGEIGINHNGDLETAKKLIEVAAGAGCDGIPVGVKGVSGSYIGSSGPVARLVCGQWSGAQGPSVDLVSESLVITT